MMMMMMMMMMIIIIIIIIICDTSSKKGNWKHHKIIQKHLSDIPGKHEIMELQKTVILGTAHIPRNVVV
jgi:ABC-type Fe3+-citrate transport system substrate-binding protein